MHRFVMFFRVIMVIAVTEVAVMSILRFIQLPQGFGEDLANAGLLIVLSAPLLYFWVAREMGSALADEHLRDFLDTGPDLVQSVDPQGHFLYVNQSWLKTLGYSRDEVSRLSMFDVIHPDHQDACKIIFERILSGEAVENIETAFVAKDGRSVIASGNINCRFEDGKPVATRGIFRIITESKQAATAMRESEERVRLLLDSTAEGIYGIDLQGNCTFANAACLRILGYESPQELLGKSIHDLVHYARADGTPYPKKECRICQAFRKEEEIHIDDEVLWRADGTSFPAEYWSYAVRREGSLAGAVVTFLDITEHKRIEAENSRLGAAIAQAAEGVIITDTEGTIEYVNPAFTLMTGYSAAEVIGKNPRILNSGQQDPAYYTDLWQTILRGQVWHGELANRRKDGTIYLEEMTIAPARDASGAITNFAAIKRDITERKRSEEVLQASEKRYRRFVEGNAAAYLRATADGRILECNESMLRMLGFGSREELQAVRAEDLYVNRAERQAMIQQLREQKTLSNFEVTFKRKDGALVFALVNISPGRRGRRRTDSRERPLTSPSASGHKKPSWRRNNVTPNCSKTPTTALSCSTCRAGSPG